MRVLAGVLLLATPLAFAADVSPGLWEITMETRVPDDPGFLPPPFKSTQCFTPEEARDPARLIGAVSNPGASGCDYTEKSYSGSSFSFSMQCAGGFGIRSTGRVSFTSDTMEGDITGVADVGGKAVRTENRLSARRIGGC